MPKRKGLGQEITKSLDIMGELHDILEKFEKTPLKEGLKVNKAADDSMLKLVNDAKDTATKLSHMIEDLRIKLNSIRTDVDERFSKTASEVIRKFLERVN